jgi:hypothetical protein
VPLFIADQEASEDSNSEPVLSEDQSDTSSEEQSLHIFDLTQEADADDSADAPLGMDFDDFLPDTVKGIEESVEPEAFSKSLMVDGKEFLKSSIVASLSSNRSKKVTI